jgi:hypothetical protein
VGAAVRNIGLLLLIAFLQPCQGKSSDPTRPYRVNEMHALSCKNCIKISAILYSKKRKIVMINNKFAHIGDTVKGYKIISIKRDKVVLKQKKKLICRDIYSSIQCREKRHEIRKV